jgi:hypothetical protein
VLRFRSINSFGSAKLRNPRLLGVLLVLRFAPRTIVELVKSPCGWRAAVITW